MWRTRMTFVPLIHTMQQHALSSRPATGFPLNSMPEGFQTGESRQSAAAAAASQIDIQCGNVVLFRIGVDLREYMSYCSLYVS